MSTPCLTAYFQTGNNNAGSNPWELQLYGVTSGPVIGQLQWDSSGDPTTMDSGATNVNFTVPQSAGNPVVWTVGGKSIQLNPGSYGNITQVTAMVNVNGGDSTSASLTIKFFDSGGNVDTHSISVTATSTAQSASVSPTSGFTAVRVTVTGTVHLVDEYPLGSTDNAGYIYVYTDTCST